MDKSIRTAALAAVCFAVSTPVLALDVAWVQSNAAAQSEQRTKAGFEAWLKENGKDWNVSFLDSGGSGEATATNLQDAASRGVDAIIITMADLRASTAAIKDAAAAGIPIFSVDSGYVEGALVDVTTNNWAMSADVSPYLLDSLGGEGKIIFLRMAEHHGTRKRGDVMATILPEYGDVEVLAEHNIDYTAFFEDTTTTMQDYVARFGDEIDAVWAPWDEPAQAAINVLKANGLTDVLVTGIDGHPQAIAEICKEDSMMLATVSQPFEGMGAQAGEWIQAIVEDGQPAEDVIPSKIVYMDAPLVTKANCADFLN
ncbi:sugar ABC transporter substrate-binding protein [Aliiruegeria lutimaris]|uniref:Monosaccharide ABC transporter substrate-binding protein, CUT2 family n=1 Tax=Aliiruegeria lutimaris TaxID=571298 RepID=A0A1G8RYK4_9RHOB|nr:sugar ABC transporter substrate-binding protein [Aliiruegeria lutimaris]SDJ22037.1 monosaccharide ABC transporter substrate-binding protein, CUT2 family [Aliiruegeria lutimaris]